MRKRDSVEVKNDYRHIDLVESEKGSSRCRAVQIMFVPAEIDININTLVKRMPISSSRH